MNIRSVANARSNRAVTVVIGAAAPVLAVIGFLVWGSQGPDPLPTHWGTGGEVNGTTGAAALFVVAVVVSVVLVALSTALMSMHRTRHASRLLVAILTAAAWLVAGIYLMSLGLSRHAASAEQVRLPWFWLVVTVAVPMLIGFVVWSILPAEPTTLAPPDATSQIHLGAAEKVVWISHAHSIGLRATAVVLVVAAGGLALFAAAPAVVCALVAVLVLVTSELTVRIDDDGLHTLWGPLAWPRHLVRLGVIAEASAQDIRPMQWGGWGFRITARGTAATIRSGPGIVVRKADGNVYVVTIDDADEGAGVLTALLQRAGERR